MSTINEVMTNLWSQDAPVRPSRAEVATALADLDKHVREDVAAAAADIICDLRDARDITNPQMHPRIGVPASREAVPFPWSSDVDPIARRAFELIGLRIERRTKFNGGYDGYSVGRQLGVGELREASLGARWR